ncbi:MAG TPA: phosphopantothenoylcysteine decarboxylase [Candidatus Dormibacteraeota bacterium]|nr:phosphopantothenoylcysteine decarboxylase [Candidatus Dormibacteraeota bacterium]
MVVTAGGTREPIDPVRFLGNRSSGKMGSALATVASEQGAQVTLISTVDAAVPGEVSVVRVETAQEMYDAVRSALADADLLLMAAAVADHRPAVRSSSKLKKRPDAWALQLVPTTDILASLQDDPLRDGVYVVGFAAETDQVLENAALKLHGKRLDLIVVNDVSRADIGMGADDNEVTVIGPEGTVAMIARAPKREIARELLRIVAARLPL